MVMIYREQDSTDESDITPRYGHEVRVDNLAVFRDDGVVNDYDGRRGRL